MEIFIYLFTRAVLLACLVVVIYNAALVNVCAGRVKE